MEENAYILGTEQAELHRLGLQHQVWSSEARRGWELGGFGPGQTILDLGCGPGFCTVELAYIVGHSGKVIGVDLSPNYVAALKQQAELHSLPIELRTCSFDEMELAPNSLDGMFCRWALAWVPNPEEVLTKVRDALKPGGRMVIHEYFDWTTLQTEPPLPHLKKGIAAAYRSMKTEQTGDIDVGRRVPVMAEAIGLQVLHTRPMSKLARPSDLTWEWPRSFFTIYLPKLVERGLITEGEVALALSDLRKLTTMPNAMVFCPMMVEVVLGKV
ncbi:MAG: methyltransferase domain-containing protein [Saprospiraceae bacterium]|nr:methyltransferase domain-containing protein [Saprospiraceae bacterium]